MNISPKISIVVPVYNVAPFLKQCLNSLINQTFKNIEIILVDDGSTDDSGVICDEYGKLDDRIKVIHKKNEGLSEARNTGNTFVNSEYLMYLDSDDWIDLNTCEETYKAIIEHQADLIFWSRIKEFPNSSIEEKAIYNNDTIFEGNSLKVLNRRLCGLLKKEMKQPTKTDAISSAWGKLYKFDIIKKNKIRFIDTNVIGSEDTLFNFYLFYYLKKAVFINKKFNHYRKFNPNSITKNHKSSLMPRYLNLFRYMNNFIIKKKLPKVYHEALSNRISLSTINLVLSISSINNDISFLDKIKDIKEILNNKVYLESYKKIEIKHLPFHWKIFFLCCKHKFTYGVYVLSFFMRKFRDN